ncbi:hypothetical protein Bca101_067432 [Brassica carinata]
MESQMIKAAVIEDANATMARFQAGLNRDIQDILEMQEYEDIFELLHKAILLGTFDSQRSKFCIDRHLQQFDERYSHFTVDRHYFTVDRHSSSDID